VPVGSLKSKRCATGAGMADGSFGERESVFGTAACVRKGPSLGSRSMWDGALVACAPSVEQGELTPPRYFMPTRVFCECVTGGG